MESSHIAGTRYREMLPYLRQNCEQTRGVMSTRSTIPSHLQHPGNAAEVLERWKKNAQPERTNMNDVNPLQFPSYWRLPGGWVQWLHLKGGGSN